MNARFKKITLNLLALLIGLILVLVMLAAAEVFLRLRRPAHKLAQSAIRHNMSDFQVEMPALGMGLKSGFQGKHTCSDMNGEIYSVTVHIDEEGRRITPVEHSEERDGAALFFGCSFTFGQGVEQEETLPACFGKECAALLPVNFGVPGYGPQHLWLQIHEEEFLDELPRDRGVVLYGIMNNHIPRLLGDNATVAEWGDWLPWLSFDHGVIEYRGLMRDWILPESPLLQRLRSLHIGRFILNRTGLMKTGISNDRDGVDALVRYFTLVKADLASLLPAYELVIFSYPWLDSIPGLAKKLEAVDIPFFDYTNLFPDQHENIGKYYYRDTEQGFWGHPKAIMHAETAKRLADDLDRYCSPSAPTDPINP